MHKKHLRQPHNLRHLFLPWTRRLRVGRQTMSLIPVDCSRCWISMERGVTFITGPPRFVWADKGPAGEGMSDTLILHIEHRVTCSSTDALNENQIGLWWDRTAEIRRGWGGQSDGVPRKRVKCGYSWPRLILFVYQFIALKLQVADTLGEGRMPCLKDFASNTMSSWLKLAVGLHTLQRVNGL